MTTDTTIDAAAARPVQRERAAAAPMPRNADGLPEPQADMSFWDVLDVVNPLQHIPIVNSIYRAVTGDEIGAPARVMGGILFGGVVGGAAAIANAVLEQSTGRDLGDHVLASLGAGGQEAGAATAVAQAPAPASAAQAASTPTTPQTVAAATAAALRPTASAAPPETAAPVPAAAAPGAASLRDALASPVGEHRPNRMPARDTIPANTMQAKQAAALANQQRLARLGESPAAAARPTASAAPPATAAPPAQATAVPVADAAAAAPGGLPPDMLPDVMLRNLAKYEAARRAAAAKAAPGLRVDG